MGQICERMEQDLRLRGGSDNMRRAYLSNARYSVAHFMPARASSSTGGSNGVVRPSRRHLTSMSCSRRLKDFVPWFLDDGQGEREVVITRR
jgi:hypothetical protein